VIISYLIAWEISNFTSFIGSKKSFHYWENKKVLFLFLINTEENFSMPEKSIFVLLLLLVKIHSIKCVKQLLVKKVWITNHCSKYIFYSKKLSIRLSAKSVFNSYESCYLWNNASKILTGVLCITFFFWKKAKNFSANSSISSKYWNMNLFHDLNYSYLIYEYLKSILLIVIDVNRVRNKWYNVEVWREMKWWKWLNLVWIVRNGF
jgi:hypothetical protein